MKHKASIIAALAVLGTGVLSAGIVSPASATTVADVAKPVPSVLVEPGVTAQGAPLAFSTLGGEKHCGRKGAIVSTGATDIFPEYQVGETFSLGSGPAWTYTKDSQTQISVVTTLPSGSMWGVAGDLKFPNVPKGVIPIAPTIEGSHNATYRVTLDGLLDCTTKEWTDVYVSSVGTIVWYETEDPIPAVAPIVGGSVAGAGVLALGATGLVRRRRTKKD